MAVSTAQIKELREMTGAGMLDCRKALEESGGDLPKAVEYLQKKSLASAAKKAGRIAAEGVVDAYIHSNGRIGVLLEVNCETDFVARTERFREFVHDVCLHIAALNPEYVSREEVSAEVMAKQKEIFLAQVAETGKPAAIQEKIVEGRIRKWFAEVCLLEQPFVKDDKRTVDEVLKSLIGEIGENLRIRRFVRYQLGEGLEKRKYDLAADIAQQIGGAQ